MRVTVCRRSSTGNRFRAGQGETVAILCGCEIPERGGIPPRADTFSLLDVGERTNNKLKLFSKFLTFAF